MRSFKDQLLLEEIDATQIVEAPLVGNLPNMGDDKQNHNLPADPPNVLVMRRKSIRQFPNGQRVALYFIDRINMYVSIPYSHMTWTPEEVEVTEEPFEENIINSLCEIVQTKTGKQVTFNDGSELRIGIDTANSILKLHESLNDENKQKVAVMLKESKMHFRRISEFAAKTIKD